jgi:hypothetical protein
LTSRINIIGKDPDQQTNKINQ